MRWTAVVLGFLLGCAQVAPDPSITAAPETADARDSAADTPLCSRVWTDLDCVFDRTKDGDYWVCPATQPPAGCEGRSSVLSDGGKFFCCPHDGG